MNPTRTQGDIKQIVIDGGRDGWVVQLHYKDGKSASFGVDFGKLSEDGMLDEVFRAIKLQMSGELV